MRDPHDRRCFQCGHIQHCIDRVIPEVTCRNCGVNHAGAERPYNYTLPWLPHSLMLRIDGAMMQEHRR